MMNLNAGPILARKAAENRHFNSALEMCEAAGELILPRFKPFERFCGPARWTVSPVRGNKDFDVVVSFGYAAGCGNKLKFSSRLSSPMLGGPTLTGMQKAVRLKELSRDALAESFISLNAVIAEQAFEAVVLEEPWRLAQIFRWR